MYLYVDFENYIWKTNDKATLTNTIAGALQNDYKNQNNKIQYNSNKVWYAFYEEPEKPPVAQIGEITYSTLEDALEAVKNGETIKLLVEEVPVTQKIAISKKIVIDMNGTKLLNNGFTIVSGGDLTLAGESGEIGDFIKVEKHGLLRIKGNITIKTQSSEAPIKSYGTVFLEHDINELMIDVWAGKFEVAESVNVSGTLRIAMKTESFSAGDKDKEVIINGSVKNLVLKQGIRESKSQATINARVETLELKHTNFAYPSADGQVGKIPTTYIGKNFSAGSIYLIPILGNGNPSYSELVDLREEGKRVADIIMLQSVPGGSISENQIDLEDVTWKCPGELDYDESDSKENYALIHYLVNPAINDKGSLVLRKIVPEMIGGIYLGGEKGDNNNHGASPEAPVASFKKAKELSEETGKPIYIVGAVKVEGTETWTFAENQESEDGSSEAQGNTKTEKAKEKPNLQRHKDYLGELVRVGSKGNLTLQNIIIDGKGVNPMIPAVGSGVDATAPIIVNEGMLNIQYGTILQNNKNVYTNIARNSGGTQFEGGGVWNSGKLNMTGGKIVGNRAVSGAGVFTQGEFKFSGNAVISENTGVILDKYGKEIVHKDDREKTSPSTGAGVFIAYSSGKMEMSGGTISGNSAAAGGGISIGNRNDWYNGGTLTMTGGSIESNEALGSDDFSGGGGIYVQMDGTATICKGSIINNKSYKGAYGGGGIYVNGGKSKEHKNGVLNLTKVKISDNTAEGAGGGIAACGTSNVEIRLTNGGIIHGNKGKNVNYDIYYTPGTPEGGGKVEKSDYMLGKGLYEWKRVKGEPLNYLCEYSAAKETTGENLVEVKICGNYSKTAGGAIGTNGNVYIGTDDDETISIKVIKKWKSDAESTEYVTGEELGSSGGINEMFTNEGIKIVLRAKLEGEGEDDWREIKSATLKPFQKGNAQWGEWGEIIFNGLQECDANGTKWIYDVVEAEDDRFTVLGKPAFKPNYDSEGKLISYTCTLTNIPTYSLKVSKEVPNFGKYPEYNEDSFKFTITLKHKDGSFYTVDELAALKIKDQESGKELPLPIENINDNEITVVLKHGEFIWLTGLTFGTKYVVKEDSNEDYDTLIKLITYNEGGSPGDTTAFSPDKFKEETVKLGTNAVIFENTVRTPLGKLRISKMVEDGDQKKAWKFTIVFHNQDGTQLGTAASKYPITKYSGIADQEGITKKIAIPGGRLTETLKHGESLEIADLPAGTKYIVTEDEANTDNYTTTVTGEGVTEVIKELTLDGQEVKKIVIGGNGNIVKDEIAHIMFTNTLNTGSLSMEKTVIGAGGDRLKSFVFTVALTGKDNKPLTGTYSYTGIATEEGVNAPAPDVLTLNARGEGQISLKHGQKITISGLPAGTSYKVTEDEANQDGYTTEETDGTGIIVKDEEKTAKFVNDKPKNPEETTTPEETPEEPTTPDESTPEESTPEETTPEESSPEESTPEESTPEETTPEETTPQETQPPAPSNPSGGGGGGRRRRITESTPPPTAEETPIPPEEVPLVSIEPEEIPLAMLPSDNSKDLTVIDDGGVPLFGLPRTGDKSIPTGALIGMMFVSLMTACGIHVKKRKEKE